MEFETLLKVLVSVAAAVAIPYAAYAAVAAIRATWGGGESPGDTEAVDDLRRTVGALQARVEQLESTEGRVLELEERLDFAERLLAGHRVLPRPRADTPPEPVESAR